MRRAREELARREPHNAHDFTYLRTTALARHAREHGYDEAVAAHAFEVFLAARYEVELFADVLPGLTSLKRRYALASLSNGNADLGRIGLEHLFACRSMPASSARPSPPGAASSACRGAGAAARGAPLRRR